MENKIKRYSHHRRFLGKYKNNRKYSNIFKLSFNLKFKLRSLQKSCRNRLGISSFFSLALYIYIHMVVYKNGVIAGRPHVLYVF